MADGNTTFRIRTPDEREYEIGADRMCVSDAGVLAFRDVLGRVLVAYAPGEWLWCKRSDV